MKVLAITKRTAELCATQSLLYAAGLELVTATNMNAARSVLNSGMVKGVIVCKSSWSDEECEEIFRELKEIRPKVTIVMRCPGCSGCDEARGIAGIMDDVGPLTTLIAGINQQ